MNTEFEAWYRILLGGWQGFTSTSFKSSQLVNFPGHLPDEKKVKTMIPKWKVTPCQAFSQCHQTSPPAQGQPFPLFSYWKSFNFLKAFLVCLLIAIYIAGRVGGSVNTNCFSIVISQTVITSCRITDVSSSTFCNVLLQLWHVLRLERAFVTREGQIMTCCKFIFLFYFSRFFQLSDHIFNRKEKLCCEAVPVALGLETYRVKVLTKRSMHLKKRNDPAIVPDWWGGGEGEACLALHENPS